MGAAPNITFGNFTGVDFNRIIQSEIASASIPIGSLNSQISNENTQITALGTIGANLLLLQSSITNLNTDATTPPQAVNVLAGAPFTATTTGSPASGVYNVTVNQLAGSQISASQGFASNTTALGTGTVTITVGGVAHAITLDATNNTVDGLASAINAAAIGVTAQDVNTGLPGAPYRLELSSNSTGAASAFTVTSALTGGPAPEFAANQIGAVSLDAVAGTAIPTVGGSYTGALTQGYHFTVTAGGTVGTDPLTIAYTSDSGESGSIAVPSGYSAGTPINVADGLTLALGSGTLNSGDQFSVAAFNPNLATAQDAEVQVGNQFVSSASNSVSNAIPGATLNLANTGGPSTVTVSQNTTNISNDVSTFVNTYNSLLSGVTNYTQTQPGQTPAILAGNGGVEGLLANLSQSLGTINLSTLGITIDSKSGQLQFSNTTFATNAASDPTGVTSALSAVYNALNPTLTSTLAPGTGLIAADTTSIQSQITAQNTQITNLQNQISLEQTTLTSEYAQLQAQVVAYQNIQQLLVAQDSSGSSGTTTSSPPIGSNLTVNG